MLLTLSFLERFHALGLLLIRSGTGLVLAWKIFPDFIRGPEAWVGQGEMMSAIGFEAGWMLWGLFICLAGFFGGVAMVLGLFTRWAGLLCALFQIIATVYFIGAEAGMETIVLHGLLALLTLGIGLIGSGDWGLDHLLE
ncbi:MAG: hypothetical protein EA425_10115 [Puniceicoccaceae bacterium]|nr:MAG: hypothetical protein EA425_10115 [Puniceicoccaceae bacterium]